MSPSNSRVPTYEDLGQNPSCFSDGDAHYLLALLCYSSATRHRSIAIVNLNCLVVQFLRASAHMSPATCTRAPPAFQHACTRACLAEPVTAVVCLSIHLYARLAARQNAIDPPIADVWLQDMVSARTQEGRKLRRQVLKGAVMVFVTAGYSGKRFIFEKAKELGVRSIIVDGPDR